MSKLKINTETGVEALAGLRADWQALFAVAASPPFLSWEWMTTSHKWFGQGKTPFVICVREGNRLIGLLALAMEELRPGVFSARTRKLSFLGETFGGADYLDVLALPERKQECANAIFEFLLKSESFGLLELDWMAMDSVCMGLLAWRFGDRDDFSYQLIPRLVCPRVNLEGGWDEVLRRSRRADNFKRRLRQLRTREDFEYRTTTQPESVRSSFERFLELHEASWAHRGGSGATGNETLRGFQGDVVEQMARANLIRFDELWVEGACRASIYGLDNGHTYYFYLSGYDLEWSNHSVGLTLLGLSIENAASRGVKVYDFLRGAEDYKFDWSNDSRMTAGVRIATDSVTARWLIAREYAKDAVRASLPKRAIQFVRKLRRPLIPQPITSADDAHLRLANLDQSDNPDALKLPRSLSQRARGECQ